MPELIALQGDCRHFDPAQIGHSICYTDPPYSPHVHSSAVSQHADGGVRVRDLGFDALTDSLRDHIARCAMHAKRWSLIYSDVEGLSAWIAALESSDATYIRPVPWVRWSMPQLSGDRPPTGCEMIICAYGADGGAKRWNGPGNLIALRHADQAPDLPSVEHKALRGAHKHKTEKPLDQALDLVNWFSDPCELVYDPLMGSGTIGVACAILGRSYLGIELQEQWAAHAKNRIDQAQRGIFSARDEERIKRWFASEESRAKRGGLLEGLS